jgi:hypothetical protein
MNKQGGEYSNFKGGAQGPKYLNNLGGMGDLEAP